MRLLQDLSLIHIFQYTKGACEILLDRCSGYLQNGNVVPMTAEIKKQIQAKNKEFADQALRVLGAAYRNHKTMPEKIDSDNLEKDMIFIGFVGMIDPCRPEVYDAIKNCKSAGIRVVMITGDHIDTATAIGKDLKIIENSSQAITGAELENLSDDELIKVINCLLYTSKE